MKPCVLTIVFALSCLAVPIAHAGAPARDDPAASQSGQPAAAQPAADKPAFKQEELDQMLAPIALYPDSLLSQILMASTYPLEIVEADRWAKANKSVKGDAAGKALEAKTWDPSVKSLVDFPDVLAMLSDKLEWTQKLGDAFIGQQKEVMDTVQKLRKKADAQGKLQTTEQQTVKVQQESSGQVIVIESSSPDVVYVPSYDPVVVYGSWPYPSYPPYPYYPPGYVASNIVSFGVGVAVGAAWGYAWGHCNWGHGDIDININQNINRNTNINRGNYGQGGKWQHNPAHREGVPYRNQASANRFGGASAAQTAQARESFRGRAESGRTDISRGGADQYRDAGAGNRAGSAGSGVQRPTGSTGSRDNAFQGVNQGGRTAQTQSDRGWSSRGSSSGGSRGGGSRGGGGRGGGRR